MSLQDAIDKVTAVVKTINGIKGADAYPLNSLPPTENWVVVYAGEGTFTMQPGVMKTLAKIVIDLHTPEKSDLYNAAKRLMPFYEAIPNALMDELQDTQLSGTISTFGVISCSGLVLVKYNDFETFVLRYVINDVKIESSIT